MSEHAIENGKAWSESIMEAVNGLEALEGGDAESVTIDGYEYENVDALLQYIYEMPLSVDIRSAWTTPGCEMEAAEYQMLLSTGGPALRIIGDLNEHGEPASAQMEWRDWGTPWTRMGFGTSDFLKRERAIRDFAARFYLGE